MTLLSICQDAAAEIGLAKPTTIIGNNAPEALKLLRYAKKVGYRLMKAVDWQTLTDEKTFTGVAGSEQTSILPDDFDRFVPETFWDRTNDIMFSGPIMPQQWQGLKAHNYAGKNKFRHRGDAVYIIPDLDGGESLAFEYVSDQYSTTSGGTAQDAWAADTDLPRLDGELITYGIIYQYLLYDGLPAEAALGDFLGLLNDLVENDQPDSDVMIAGDIFSDSGGRHFSGVPPSSGASLFSGAT